MFTEIAQLYQSYLKGTGSANNTGNAFTFLMFTEHWSNLSMEQAYGVIDNMVAIGTP